MSQSPYLDELIAKTNATGDPNFEANSAAYAAARDARLAGQIDKYGTPLLDSKGQELIGYSVNGSLFLPGQGMINQDGSLPGATPVYGRGSRTVSMNEMPTGVVDAYKQSDRYAQDVAQRDSIQQDILNQQERKSSFSLGKLIPGIALALSLGGAASTLAPAALSGSGMTGISTGNAATGSALSGLTDSFSLNSALSGALKGGVSGLASGGDLKDALMGAGLGGLSSYVTAGGNVPGIGNIGETIDWNQGGQSVLREGSGILGGAANLGRDLGLSSTGGGASSLLGGGGSMLGDALKAGAGLYSYGQTKDTNEDILRLLQQAGEQSIAQTAPYQTAGENAITALSAGFSQEDLSQDPGYQFQLAEGNKALDSRLSAMGMTGSGAALKEALKYSQGLADTTYNDAYNRWLAQNQPLASLGSGAASSAADIYGNIGAYGAQALSENQRAQNELLASLFGGGQSSLQKILSGGGIFA